MEPTMTCPSDHILKDNVCTIAPTMSCPTGYTLVNGMCQPDEISGFGDSMNIPPTQNGILSQTIMSDSTPPPQPQMSPVAVAPPSSPAAARPPVSPVGGSGNCPSGYSLNKTDNMCYPL